MGPQNVDIYLWGTFKSGPVIAGFNSLSEIDPKHMTKPTGIYQSFPGDRLALPKGYLTDQPDLDEDYEYFLDMAAQMKAKVIEKLRDILNGTVQVNENSLENLEKNWTNYLKKLTFSRDELKLKHLYRPIKV